VARSAYQQLTDARGDLSAFLAVAMLLPLLLVLAFGGAETVHLLGIRALVVGQAYSSLRSAEMAGGVTSAISQSLRTDIDSWTGSGDAGVSGTTPPQPWGQQICLTVDAPAEVSWPGLGITVNLGGTFCGASDLPPSGT
jgi:hypothetical protein